MSDEFLQFAKREIEKCIIELNGNIGNEQADSIAGNLVNLIDWSNSALMHKGIRHITSSYMKQNNLL